MGLAASLLFAAEGADVAILDVQEAEGHSCVDEI
jgi:NAD(P)-dependent dehydrogenase (short-subunit alcohol dehydrogenase family)